MSEALQRAGLEVLGTTPGVLSTEEAWKRVVNGNVTPTSTVDYEADGYLADVAGEWRRLAAEHGIVDADETFLISLPGPGSWGSPWTIVRRTSTTSLTEGLADEHGELEFVTAARDGSAVLGVTTEEDGIWLIVA